MTHAYGLAGINRVLLQYAADRDRMRLEARAMLGETPGAIFLDLIDMLSIETLWAWEQWYRLMRRGAIDGALPHECARRALHSYRRWLGRDD